MSGKAASQRARKSTGKNTRTARKTKKNGTQDTVDENDEDIVTIPVKDKKRRRDEESDNEEATSSEDDNDRIENTLVLRPSNGNKASKDKKSTSSKDAGKTGRKSLGGKAPASKSKAEPDEKRRKSTTGTTPTTEETKEESSDDEEVSRLRSQSVRGYNWDAERLDLHPSDIKNRLKKHKKITAELRQEDGSFKMESFHVGMQVYVCPNPDNLHPRTEEIDIEELPDEDWWVAEIVECLSLDQSSQGTQALGLLKVAWFYDPDDCKAIKTLEKGYFSKIRNYRFDPKEAIASDHYDYIGMETVAGNADDMYCFLRLSGLAVSDEDRLRPEYKRKKSTRLTRMQGWTLKKSEEEAVRQGRWKPPVSKTGSKTTGGKSKK